MLACVQSGDGNLCMDVVGRADADDVDFRIVDDIHVIGAAFFKAESLLRILCDLRHNVAYRLEYRVERRRPEQLRHIAVRYHMGLAHKSRAYQAYV